MFHEHLTHSNQANLVEIYGEYSLQLVVLSIIIACLASYTALTLNERVKNNSFFHKNFWFVLASVAMGSGIWAMHYVGMFAFSLPVGISYNIAYTIASIIPALLASFIAFHIANRPKQSVWSHVITSITMSIGATIMHYMGMASMKTEVIHSYNLVLLILSIAISFFVFYIFHFFKRLMHKALIRLMISITMGIAVASVHYIGMLSMNFYISKDYAIPSTTVQVLNINLLVLNVMIGIVVLLGTLLLSSLGDKFVEYRTQNFDTLTRLPNYRKFEEDLKNTDHYQLAIWHIHDLEYINREYGYQIGDIALQRLADLFESFKPGSAKLYRIERGRFVYLSKKFVHEMPLQAVMEDVARELDQPLDISQEKLVISAICTISSAQGYKENSNLYAEALAVLNCPSISFNREVIHYNPDIHKSSFEDEIVEDIVRAMKQEELYLVYQPKIGGNTSEVVGLETLLRWNHPKYGFLSPALFIPILEKSDRMIIVTDWIIEKVCSQISKWREEGISFQQVAINIPGHYVTSPHLLDVLKQTIARYQLNPQHIELEITETSFVKSMEEAMRAVFIFRQQGFSVALDDFGTGVSSLSYLKQMMISTLKIDKSFVDDIPSSIKDSAIIKAIIALGESLELEIVVEGVETKEQVDFITSVCKNPILQGYYFAKPMRPEELKEWSKEFQEQMVK